ncbi:MAG: signal peptidase II [Myxococcales bacterium]|jgi:signal peptidase II
MKRMDAATIAKAFFLIALGVGIDQWTKVWAQARLPGSPLEVIPKALSFVYAENRNMAFGLGGFLPPSAKLAILLALTGALTLLLLVLMVRSPDFASRLGYGVTAAGALGNIVDRVRLGYVVDFIYWHGGFTWPNFNVADILVCTGVGILLVFGNRAKAADAKVAPAR